VAESFTISSSRSRRPVRKRLDTPSYTLTTINTPWEATQRVMTAKLTKVTHKITIQLHLVAESYTICSSRGRRPVRKLLDTPLYIISSANGTSFRQSSYTSVSLYINAENSKLNIFYASVMFSTICRLQMRCTGWHGQLTTQDCRSTASWDFPGRPVD
jgi:hypothetical protein